MRNAHCPVRPGRQAPGPGKGEAPAAHLKVQGQAAESGRSEHAALLQASDHPARANVQVMPGTADDKLRWHVLQLVATKLQAHGTRCLWADEMVVQDTY